MAKIVGITIGPIIETISESKKIYEIANASSFFSNIIYEFLCNIETDTYDIITPNFKDSDKCKNKNEKFYPDRVVLKVKDASRKEEEILKEIDGIYQNIVSNEKLIELKDYLNFNIIVEELDEENIKKIFEHLDGIELIKNFSNRDEIKDIIKRINRYLENKKTLNKEFDVNFGMDNGNEESGYRAIIALDLDNMGKFSQKKLEETLEISEAVYRYIESLNKFISKKYGKNQEGLVLYSAGDDVLAILNPKHIFEFIEEACNKLNEIFSCFENKDLSVSFGIFICYAKYPIKEAIEKAHSLLFSKAKAIRNTASILIEKHSGQSVEINLENLIDKEEGKFNSNNNYFKYMKNSLSNGKSNSNDEENKERLLNAIVQKVSRDSFIFEAIINSSEKEKMIKSYLSELFDAKLEGKEQLEYLEKLLCSIEDKEKFSKEFRQILSFFRMLKFYVSRGKGEGR